MDSPLLSIVIPTKNRQEYAAITINDILCNCSDRVEIVIQDNSDNSSLKDLISSCSRVKYAYHEKPLPFSDNFELALSLTGGDYICYIGDDDTVLPMIESVARAAKKAGIDVVIPSSNPPSYIWKDNMNLMSETLTIPFYSFKVTSVDTKSNVCSLLSNGGLDYLSFPLGKTYHGLVSKQLLHDIRSQNRRCFGGLSPDIYSSIVVSLAAKNAVLIDCPLTIAGVCPASGSGVSMKGKHEGSLNEAPHFRYVDYYEWDPRVPHFYCVETIWADSALHACHDSKFNTDSFNSKLLAARCLYSHPKAYENPTGNKIGMKSILFSSLKDILIRAKRVLCRKLRRRTPLVINKVYDLNSARNHIVSTVKTEENITDDLINNLFTAVSNKN